MEKEIRQVIVDTLTGEVVNDIRVGDRFSITRSSQLEHLSKQYANESFIPDAKFIKVFIDPLHELKKALTSAELTFLIDLIGYISYESGILQYANGNSLSRSDISDITNVEMRWVDTLLASLIKKQVLGKHRTGKSVCFTANPYLFCRGQKVNKTLKKLYEKSKWATLIK